MKTLELKKINEKNKNVVIEKADSQDVILDKLYIVLSKLFADADREKMKLKKYTLLSIKKDSCSFEYNVSYSQYSIKFKNLCKYWIVSCGGLCENNFLQNCTWNTGKYIVSLTDDKIFCYSEKDFYDETVFEHPDFAILDELNTNYNLVKEKINEERKESYSQIDTEEPEAPAYKVENIILLIFKVNTKAHKDFDKALSFITKKYGIKDYELKQIYSYDSDEKKSVFDSYLYMKYINYKLPLEDFEKLLIKDVECLLFGYFINSYCSEYTYREEQTYKDFIAYRDYIHNEFEEYCKNNDSDIYSDEDFNVETNEIRIPKYLEPTVPTINQYFVKKSDKNRDES